jgi:photosystem II stability/assembly factor-like uncharacterized protein/predicted acyltransferase (DUF342 family)
MSWKKYGGTNKLDKINNISVNTVVTDKFTLKDFYVGDWDICGGLLVKDDANLSSNLNVVGNVAVGGDITISGAMNVLDTDIFGDIFVANDAYIRENIYMDQSGGTMLRGENRMFGFNTSTPQATIDISGDLVRTIDIHTSTTTNKNVIARNVYNQGMTVNVETTRSYIDFYVDNSMNLSTENYNGRLVYETGGNFTIDVSNIVKFKPRVIFSQDLSKGLIADERMIIYTNPLSDVPYLPTVYNNASFKTGTAAFMIAGDNSSNVFFRLGTEKGSGMTMGGGYFPDNKIMGTIALIDPSNTKYPAMNIISGNLTANLKTSVGVNKYNVSVDGNNANRYAMDVNGPVKFGYQEIIVAADISFEVFSMQFFGNTGFAVGSPSTITAPFTQYFLKTTDGGYTWTYTRLVDLSLNPNPNSVEDSRHYFYSMFMLSESDILIAGDSRYFYRSTNGGNRWTQIAYNTNNSVLATSIFVTLDTRLIIGIDGVGADNGSIVNTSAPNWQTNLDPSNNKILYTPIPTGLSKVNAIHGYDLDTVIVGINGIRPYRAFNGLVGGTFGQHIATDASMNAVNVFRDGSYNHVVAVGKGKIYYTHNLLWTAPAYTVSWSNVSITGILRSVKILDTMRAIAVGDSGLIMYSIDGFATWNTVSQAMLDGMGNGSLLSNVSLSNISILNANDFVVSGTIQTYNSHQGRTKMFNLYAPYFLNRPNNHVIEASGNMVVSGDLQVNDAGQILTNTPTFNILPTVASEINIGNTAVGGNTNVKANLDVTLNITGNQKLIMYGDSSLNSKLFVYDDVSLNSKLFLRGDASLNQRLNVGGDASFNSKFYVYDDVSFNSKLFLRGDASFNQRLNVGGDASFNSKFYVYDDVSFNSKLFLRGDASFNQKLNVGGDASFNSKFYVYDDVSFNSKLFLRGDASFNQRLNVGGDASFNGKFYVYDDVSFNSKLFLRGDASFNQKLNVGGDASFNSKFYVYDDVSFNSKLFLRGDASFNQRLNVGGDASFNSKFYVYDDVSFNSKLFVNKDVSFNQRLNVGGDASFNSKFYVYDDVSFNSKLFLRGDASFNQRLNVGGDASFNSKFYVYDDVSFNSKLFLRGDASFNQQLNVGGDASFNSKFYVYDDVSFNSKLFVNKDVSFNQRLNVGGDVSFNSKFYVYDDVSFNSKLFLRGDASFNQKLSVGGDASFNSKFYVYDDVSFNSKLFLRGDASFNQRLNVGGDASFNSKFYVYDDVSFNSKLFLRGDASLNQRLNVGGDVSFNSKLYVYDDVSFNSKLFVSGDASLNQNLFVSGRTKMVDISGQNMDLSGNMKINTIDSYSGSLINIGGSTTTINIGNAASNITFYGNLFLPGSITTTTVTNLEVKNKTILLNDESALSGNSMFSGLQYRDNNSDNRGYFLINGNMTGFLFKSTQSTNRVNLDISELTLQSGSQGIVLIKPLTGQAQLDISADYTITTGLIGTGDIQNLDASLNRRVERDIIATTETVQVLSTGLLASGIYANKLVSNIIENSQLDIFGNAFITKLGLGTSEVNENYSLEVNGSTRVVNNIDVGGIIHQW